MRVQRDLVIKINIRILVPLLTGEPGGQQGLLQRSGFRDLDRLAVKMRSSSLLCGKQLIARGIVNDRSNASPVLTGCPMLQAHGNAEDRKSVREVRRAVERIDVPAI